MCYARADIYIGKGRDIHVERHASIEVLTKTVRFFTFHHSEG